MKKYKWFWILLVFILTITNTEIDISSIIYTSLTSLPCFSDMPGMVPPWGVATLALFSVPTILTPDTYRVHSLTSFRSSMKCHLHKKDISSQPIQNCKCTNSPLSPLLFPFCILFYFVLLSSNIQYDFPGSSDGKVSAYNVRDLGSIPGLGRSPGEWNDTPLQYSCVENPMDGGAW